MRILKWTAALAVCMIALICAPDLSAGMPLQLIASGLAIGMVAEGKVTMVAFRSHVRDDGQMVRKGQEFEATAEESHAYAARENPLAGPLDGVEQKAKPRAAAKPKSRTRGGKKAK